MSGLTPEQERYLENLFREHLDDLVFYARRLLPQRSSPEDIVQEAFAVAVRRVETVMTHEAPKLWLRKVVRNLCLNEYRRYERYEKDAVSLEMQFEEPSINGPEASNRAELFETIADAVDRLKPAEQYLFRRFFQQGAGHKAIATELGITEWACQKRLERIRDKIRKYVTKEYGDIF